MLAEWKFSEKFKISCKTIGRVARPVSVSGILISRNGSSQFFICSVQTFSNIVTAGGGGGGIDLSLYRNILFDWSSWWGGHTVLTGEQDVRLSASVTWQPLTCQTMFYPSTSLASSCLPSSLDLPVQLRIKTDQTFIGFELSFCAAGYKQASISPGRGRNR